MVKNKIKMLLQYRNSKQSELIDVLGVSSKQAVTNKFSLDRFTIQDIIKICEHHNCHIEIVDNDTNQTVVTLDENDIKKEPTPK
ncbi:MAG: hypothetical protein Q4A76_05270 [Porphyromonadaceae bacterium]|nr:hypothetical protein [Porphyromonadaceae bacterium]